MLTDHTNLFFGVEKLWISFCLGDNHSWIPVHDVCQEISLKIQSILFFYTFTVCSVASAFVERWKSYLAKWNAYPEASTVCTNLVWFHPLLVMKNKTFWKSLSSPCMTDLVKPHLLMHGVRLDMSDILYDTIPPTSCIPSRLHLTTSNIHWKPY